MGRHENGAFPLFALPQPDFMHRKDQMGHVNAGRCPHEKGEPPPSPHIARTRRADVAKVHRCLFFYFLTHSPHASDGDEDGTSQLLRDEDNTAELCTAMRMQPPSLWTEMG